MANDIEDIKSEFVKIDDLTKSDFPQVNENAVKAFSENSEESLKNAANTDLEGYDSSIHESPPRKNKLGQWAKKRGNKKGFFPKTEKGTKPDLVIPENAADIEVAEITENAAAENLENETRQTAFILSGAFYFGLKIWADYTPEADEQSAHTEASYKYLMTRGGCSLPPWAELASVSLQSISKAAQKEKARSRMSKMKDWFIAKVYAFKNRKSRAAAVFNP